MNYWNFEKKTYSFGTLYFVLFVVRRRVWLQVKNSHASITYFLETKLLFLTVILHLRIINKTFFTLHILDIHTFNIVCLYIRKFTPWLSLDRLRSQVLFAITYLYNQRTYGYLIEKTSKNYLIIQTLFQWYFWI